MRTVYLAGPINGCTNEEAHGWRRDAAAHLAPLGWTVLDPMRRDYRGNEAESVAAIVQGDLYDIFRAAYLLVNATRPSWGTAMELVYAHRRRRIAIAFGAQHPSPWLTYHCAAVLPTLADALRDLTERAA